MKWEIRVNFTVYKNSLFQMNIKWKRLIKNNINFLSKEKTQKKFSQFQ